MPTKRRRTNAVETRTENPGQEIPNHNAHPSEQYPPRAQGPMSGFGIESVVGNARGEAREGR